MGTAAALTLGLLAAEPVWAQDEACEGTDVSELGDMWNVEEGMYKLGEGEVCVDSELYEFSVQLIDVSENSSFPTNQRVIVRVAPDLGEAFDRTDLHFMGWAEMPATLEGGVYLPNHFRVANLEGWENPQYLGVNPSARGTAEYAEDGQNISKITNRDEKKDVGEIISKLDEQGIIQGNVGVMSHSLGFVGAMTSLAHLDGYVDVTSLWMPATDQPFGLFRWRFISAVWKHVPIALTQTVTGRDYVPLNCEDYQRIMMSGFEKSALENCEKGIKDSARRFVGATFTVRHRFRDALLMDGYATRQDFVVTADNEGIIPESMPRELVSFLNKNDVDVTELTLHDSPHAIRVEMTDEQEADLRRVLFKIMPSKELAQEPPALLDLVVQ